MAGDSRSLPVGSDNDKLKSKKACPNLKGSITTANMLHEKSDGVFRRNKASLPFGTNRDSRKRNSSEIEEHWNSSETVGVGRHRTASWMSGDSAEGRRCLQRWSAQLLSCAANPTNKQSCGPVFLQDD
jgi:hypothetical protein